MNEARTVAPPHAFVGGDDFVGLLDEYLTFLQHHRGLRDSTLYARRKWGRRFFTISPSTFRIVIWRA
jgi:hypothetical protein